MYQHNICLFLALMFIMILISVVVHYWSLPNWRVVRILILYIYDTMFAGNCARQLILGVCSIINGHLSCY